MSAKVKNILGVVAVAIGVIGVVAYGLSRRKSGDSSTPPAADTRADDTHITLRGRVPISVNVPVPKYRVIMEVPAGSETEGSASPAPKPTPRPRTPSPAVAPPPAPKKTNTVKVIVFNGLTNSLEVRYRNAETDPGRLADEGATKRQTIEVGEETAVDGVPVGEYLTVTEKDAAGKMVGTLDCKIDPDRGPVRMLHVRETMMYYPRKR